MYLNTGIVFLWKLWNLQRLDVQFYKYRTLLDQNGEHEPLKFLLGGQGFWMGGGSDIYLFSSTALKKGTALLSS